MERRLFGNKPSRLGTLRAACHALRRQGRASGAVLGVLVGHLVYSFKLFRPLLSILRDIFRVIFTYGDKVLQFSNALDAELRISAALLPLAVCDGAAATVSVVLASDVDLLGFALLTGRFDCDLVSRSIAGRERRRFRPERAGPTASLGAQTAVCAGAGRDFDRWADGQVTEEVQLPDPRGP